MLDLNNILSMNKDQFNKLEEHDQKTVVEIIKEFKKYGRSELLESLWYQDYEEIPVSIQEFISNPHYLGKSTRNGESIYPYWKQKYNEIFDDSLGYEEIVLSGAIGVGKTKTADVCLAYLLYKLMCLKNPQEYFRFNEGDKITIFFLNINLKLAEGVGFRALHEFLLNSPWFMERGTTTGRTKLLYKPPKNIDITYGSKGEHALGQQVYCLSEDTKVITDNGIYTIKELCDKKFKVYTVGNNKLVSLSNEVTAKCTTTTDEYYEITLEDGSVIKCTDNHKFLLSNNTYKNAKDLQVRDILHTVNVIRPNRNTIIQSIPNGLAKVKNVCKKISHKPIEFYDVIDVEPNHNFVIQTNKGRNIVSHNCSCMDEIDFTRGGIKGGDVLNAQNGIMQAYTTIKERINSRFIKNGVQYGRLFLVSSKKSEHDFIEAYIRKMQSQNQADKMLIVDEPQWVIKPANTFSKERFPVAVGNRSLKSMVLPDNLTEEERKAYIKQGYEILDVPINLKQSFLLDVNTALMNLAGKSVIGATSFFNFDMFSKCYITDYHNPFTVDVITTGIHDELQIANFFEIRDIPVQVRTMPQFIHIDASLTGDKTGISSVGVSGIKETKQYNGAQEIITNELTYKHIFSVDIKAPNGSEISFEKTRQFIYFLKASGFNIRGVSLDGFQSADMKQMLLAQGYDATIISLDKTPQGYLALRSAMNDGRIGLIQIDLLETELIQLQRDIQTGKIDHPLDGCFTGDTKIQLADGNTKQIIDLVGKEDLYTYGVKNNVIIKTQIKKIWLTKYVNLITNITLSNSEVVRCTCNHRFLLVNGDYTEAKNLKISDKLYCKDKQLNIVDISFTKYSDPIPVFDMEVPETNNFLLASGVFVHNSKDMSDSLAGALWNATLHKQSLIDGLALLETAADINEDIDPQQAFMQDFQQSLMTKNHSKPITTANDDIFGRLNSLIDDYGYGNSDIIGW